MIERIKYDVRSFPFRTYVEKFLEFNDLERIHEQFMFKGRLTSSMGNIPDQGQYLHKKFYSEMDSDPSFKFLYDEFIKKIVAPHFSQILFQKYPTFRVHQPDNICVFKWHKDSDFNHSPKELNIFMPITHAYDTNTIWAESEEGSEEYAPIEANYGEIVIWKGAVLKHGNKINVTSMTRISFDFRILELSDYIHEANKASVSKGNKFVRGDYFDNETLPY